MFFVKPKIKRNQKVNWKISPRIKAIVSAYAKYSDRSEDELIEEFLFNLALDPSFQMWVQKQRYSKRLIEFMDPNYDYLAEEIVDQSIQEDDNPCAP